jgi:hypothetical protein
MMETFENAQIGDKVWDFKYGWGEIISINKNGAYPIRVKFDNNEFNYTLDGKWDKTDITPTLFWNKFEIPKEAYEKPLPDLAIDTPVLVRDSEEDEEWRKRHFAGWTKSGKIECWKYGTTAWTADSEVYYDIWDYWKLPEEV